MENVSHTRTSGPGSWLSLYGLFCLSLGFMVFAWGTNYKLSLYNAGHQNLPAKVCTRASDAAKNAVDHAANGNTVPHAFLSIAVFFSALRGTENDPVNRLAATKQSSTGRHSAVPRFSIFDHHLMKDPLSISRWR